jgi:predicted dehydrogenase
MRAAQRPVRVLIWGDREAEVRRWARAVRSVPQLQLAGIAGMQAGPALERSCHTKVYDVEAALRDTEISSVLLLDDVETRAAKALDGGKNLWLASPAGLSVALAEELARSAARAGLSLIGLLPWLHYPPIERLRALMHEHVVGRVSMLRMRSLLGGSGGWDGDLINSPDWPKESEPPPDNGLSAFRNEVGHKLALARTLLGAVSQVACVGRPSAKGPWAAVVTFKHEELATYGFLEVAYAPGLRVRSADEPREDALELTGSAGILWLTRGVAQLRSAPTLSVYRGDHCTNYECEDDAFETAWARCLAASAMKANDSAARKAASAELVLLARDVEAVAEAARAGGRFQL